MSGLRVRHHGRHDDGRLGTGRRSGGFSVARRERLEPPDAGWLFHGSEVLVGEQTLSCTFCEVVGPDWVTRRVEVRSVSTVGEAQRRLKVSDGHWTVDGAARPDLDGSLMLGIHDASGRLASVGVIGALPMATRKALFAELAPLVTTFDDHPWAWARGESEQPARGTYASRWNAGKDLSFTPLRPERVVEVRYDYMEDTRFRHTAQFVRWRPDRDPASCTFDQLERPVTFAIGDVLRQG